MTAVAYKVMISCIPPFFANIRQGFFLEINAGSDPGPSENLIKNFSLSREDFKATTIFLPLP
ncbi:hypothetical protein L0337_43895 [candidate division KSB1 bacterium]|nr:hypothetical protein [candidate division KSB1 bacterium]